MAKSADALNGTVLVLCTATALALQVFSNSQRLRRHLPRRRFAAAAGPLRMVASGRISQSRMRAGLALAALLCCVLGIALLAAALPAVAAAEPAVWLLWLLLGARRLAAQGFRLHRGRKPYGYQGWGDFSVLLFFGWLGVLGSAWLQSGQLHPSALLPATALGLWCSMVLNLNRSARHPQRSGCRQAHHRRADRPFRGQALSRCAFGCVCIIVVAAGLPLAFDEAAQGRLKAILLLALAFIHLYFLKKRHLAAHWINYCRNGA